MQAHILGFPRIGAARELKFALESYWAGKSDRAALEQTGRDLRARHWAHQQAAGLDFVTVGDFAFYDQVLNTSALLGAIPARFQDHAHANGTSTEVDLDTLFLMARGRTPCGCDAPAAEMTKWFDTNYHYLVPELTADQAFALSSQRLFDEVREAQALGHSVKAVLLGPVSYLWLSKAYGEDFDRLSLLDRLLPIYVEIINRLADLGVSWLQIDEPIL